MIASTRKTLTALGETYALCRRLFTGLRSRVVALTLLAAVMSVLEAAVVFLIAKTAAMLTSGDDEVQVALLGSSVTVQAADVATLALVIVVVRTLGEFTLIELRARTEARYERSVRRRAVAGFLGAT